MSNWADPRSLLRHAGVYKAFQSLIGGRRARRRYIERFVKPPPGSKILDIGCGPGDILDFLPPVNYVGFDLSADYIATAQRVYGDRGTFICGRVDAMTVPEPGTFDVVMAAGVLHHLDDAEAEKLCRVAAHALNPTGRFVTLDGCFVAGQSRVAKRLLEADRGQFVRTQPAYEALATPSFAQVTAHIEEAFFKVPYTLLIMTCSDPR